MGDDAPLLVERVVQDVLPPRGDVAGRRVVSVGEVEARRRRRGARGARGRRRPALGPRRVVRGQQRGGEGHGLEVGAAVEVGVPLVPSLRGRRVARRRGAAGAVRGRRRARVVGGVVRGPEEALGPLGDALEGRGRRRRGLVAALWRRGGAPRVRRAGGGRRGGGAVVVGRRRAAAVGREAVEEEELGEDVVGLQGAVFLVDGRIERVVVAAAAARRHRRVVDADVAHEDPAEREEPERVAVVLGAAHGHGPELLERAVAAEGAGEGHALRRLGRLRRRRPVSRPRGVVRVQVARLEDIRAALAGAVLDAPKCAPSSSSAA